MDVKGWEVECGNSLEARDIRDNYFYGIRSLLEKIVGYYNVGTDLCNGEYCGNTVICALNDPIATLENENIGVEIKDMIVIAGKLAATFGCTNFPPYRYDDSNNVKYKDYHFFKNCPLKNENELRNNTVFSGMQYYYLCDFVKSLNDANCKN